MLLEPQPVTVVPQPVTVLLEPQPVTVDPHPVTVLLEPQPVTVDPQPVTVLLEPQPVTVVPHPVTVLPPTWLALPPTAPGVPVLGEDGDDIPPAADTEIPSRPAISFANSLLKLLVMASDTAVYSATTTFVKKSAKEAILSFT